MAIKKGGIVNHASLGETMKRLIFLSLLALTAPAQADMLSVMSKYEGMSETRNRKALSRMVGVDVRRIPWCGAMLTYVAKKSGKRPPAGSFRAISWTKYGKPVKPRNAKRGDVAIVRGGRHVIVFTHWQGNRICGVSGNSSNAVRSACYGGLIGVRR